MNNLTIQRTPYTRRIYRPFWIIISCFVIILTVALAILINSSWRAQHRTAPLKAHITIIEEIQHYNAELSTLALKLKSLPTEQSSKQLNQLYQRMTDMLNASTVLSDAARIPLLQVTQTLKNIKSNSIYDLALANKNLESALHVEVGIQNNLLHLLDRDNWLELETTTFIAISLPVLSFLMLFFLRHRILRPLDNLSLLISRLGKETLPFASLDEIDPLLKPLFVNFNQLVQRLAELEKAQLKHQLELENKVRDATQSLLEYQYTLAHSERLAAVGELTAGLAHELRNPLAGIHMALANLQNEIDDSDKNERLTLIIEELDRITKLLNQVHDQSRHSPEPFSHFNLAEMINSLLQLVRYQIPATIIIDKTVANDLKCNLPQGRLKQALLNLILNAAQSIGKSPGNINLKITTHLGKLLIQVSDNGKGFSKKILEHGIQPFMTGKDHGTGLGLAIVRRFCYELGGELHLTNASSGGARVEILLPGNTVYE